MKPSMCSLLLLMTIPLGHVAKSQGCAAMNIEQHANLLTPCGPLTMNLIHDALGRPYLYVANKEAGLRIYDVDEIDNPQLVATVPTHQFDTLDVMNVTQDGNFLYLAVGNHFVTIFTPPQHGGMAIVDVTNPLQPVVTDYYVVPNSVTGAGIVKVEGTYAYLGAMRDGLIILDVSDKRDIHRVSQFIPNVNYPPVPHPVVSHYLARGMEVKNGVVYLCYDAGGLRIINCTNRSAPVETGRYCNPVMWYPLDLTRGYNSIVLEDSLAYIAVDYCGMEVLNITDTSTIALIGWWNPYDCPGNDWYHSAVHATEIQLDTLCRKIFLSTGASDLHVIDVSDPAHPDSCSSFGGVPDSIGTWGIGRYQDQIYLAYICTLNIPFPSDSTGFKILTYTPCTLSGFQRGGTALAGYSLRNNYPNPFNGQTNIEYTIAQEGLVSLKLIDVLGQVLITVVHKAQSAGTHSARLDASGLASGVYFYRLQVGDYTATKKLVLVQ